MPAAKLKQFLDTAGVPYETIRHTPTYSSGQTAAATQTRGDELAKVVMVKIDGRVAMAVLPSTRRLSLERLAVASHARHTTYLINEDEFAQSFPDCEIGAMPPFGNLYGMDVFVDKLLTDDHHITFNAGTHRQAMRIAYGDFQRLVNPVIANLSD